MVNFLSRRKHPSGFSGNGLVNCGQMVSAPPAFAKKMFFKSSGTGYQPVCFKDGTMQQQNQKLTGW